MTDIPSAALAPTTILWHKPPDVAVQVMLDKAFEGMTEKNRAPSDRSGIPIASPHFKNLVCATQLETGASGLVVFTQDFAVKRKLIRDSAFMEHEIIVDIAGAVSDEQLYALNRPQVKVALNKQTDTITGLRFAIKGYAAGSIAAQCERMGLIIEGMKRLRVGRMPLSSLKIGEWRFLMGYERF